MYFRYFKFRLEVTEWVSRVLHIADVSCKILGLPPIDQQIGNFSVVAQRQRELFNIARLPSMASSSLTVSAAWFGNMLTTNSYGLMLAPSLASIS